MSRAQTGTMRPLRGFTEGQAVGVAGYRDVFGQSTSRADLIRLLGCFPVEQWLSFLSRLSTLLAPPFLGDPENARVAFHGVLSKDIRRRLEAFWARSQLRVQHRPFSYAQLRVLQELALLHACDACQPRIQSDADFDVLGRALLSTWDLMQIPKGETNPLGALMHAYAREPKDGALDIAARAYHLFGLGEATGNRHAEQLAVWFECATSQPLEDYLYGGLIVALRQGLQSADELAQTWHPTPYGQWIQNPEERRRIDAFHALRCAPIARLKEEVARIEGDREIWQFSGLGLARFPIVEIGDGRRFVLDQAEVARSLIEGVRDLLVECIDNRQVSGVGSSSRIGAEFGNLFDDYIASLLRDAMPHSAHRLSQQSGRRAADFRIEGRSVVVVGESKSAQLKRARTTMWCTVDDWEHGLARMIGGATQQLAATIQSMHEFLPPFDRYRDWTTTSVVPVIVTNEALPLLPAGWQLYEHLSSPLRDLPLASTVSRLRILSVNDIEDFGELAVGHDVGGLLYRWAHCPETRESSFMNFRAEHGVRTPGEWHERRRKQVMADVARKIGIEWSPGGEN